MKNGDVAHLKRRKQNPAPVGLVEPVRKTMYDILVDNLKSANRATFLHRIIYVGYHRYYKVRQDQIVDCFSKIISTVNEAYCIERLTGLLVYYNRHFIHLVEGDEDSINNHLELLLKDEEFEEYFGTVKLLIHVSHISKRIMPGWHFYFGTPSKLIEKIEMKSLHESGTYTFQCLRKLYGLVDHYVKDYCVNVHPTASLDTFSSEEIGRKLRISQISVSPSTMGLAVTDPYKHYLPEEEYLSVLIDSDFTMNITAFLKLYLFVPQRDIYKDKVWPVPSAFIPFDVFEPPYENNLDLDLRLKKRNSQFAE